MVSGFVIRCWLRFLPLFLSVPVFAGCGMMSVLVDEDAGESTADSGDTGDSSDSSDAGSSIDASEADAIPDGCGDGIIDGRLGEECETDSTGVVNTGGATCTSALWGTTGITTGILGCNDHCRFDFSLCTNSNDFGDGGIGDGGFSPFSDGGPVI